MTRFYIVRHGESLGNDRNLFLGHTDLGLTEKGHAQAEKTAQYLMDKPIDILYSSDLKRAYDTCKLIADVKGLQIQLLPGLREIFAGKWEGVSFEELGRDYPTFNVWLTDIGASRPDEGESVAELKQRVEDTFVEIAQANIGKTVCVVTHATPIRAMSTVFRRLTVDEIKKIPWVANASVTEVLYLNGRWTLISEGYNEYMGDISTELPSNV